MTPDCPRCGPRTDTLAIRWTGRAASSSAGTRDSWECRVCRTTFETTPQPEVAR